MWRILRRGGKRQEDVESSTLVLLSITLIESNRRKAVIQISPFETQGYASYFYALSYGIKLDNYPAGGLDGYTRTAERAVNK